MLPDLKPRPTIRAKVRIGIKENGRPKATDFFHSTDEQFTELLGTPTELFITVPYADPDEAFQTSLELWGPGVLKCRSEDTQTAKRRLKDGTTETVECQYRDCQFYGPQKCGAIGRLRFQIPELGHGLFILETSSWNSMRSIAGALDLAKPVNPDQRFRLSVAQGERGGKKFRFVTMEPVA